MKTRFLLLFTSLPLWFACGDPAPFGAPEYDKPGGTDGADGITSTVLFKNAESIGNVRYVTFRIPSIVRTDNKVFAICEARTVDADRGDIDICCRVSTDDGKTWGDKKVLFSDGIHTVGNPCCVWTTTRRLVMVFNWHSNTEATAADYPTPLGVTNKQKSVHSRRVFVTWSDDEGATWIPPKDITEDVMESNWTWNAAGPCHGIQLRNGPHKGRIIIPCDLKTAGGSDREHMYSYAIWSDDNGATWHKSSTIIPYGNESCAVERSDGKIHLDMRNANCATYPDGKSCRTWSISEDGGDTWLGYHYDESRPEPTTNSGGTKGCQGSVINYNPDGGITSNILFSNPANATSRKDMTLRFSKDNGEHWPGSLLLTGNYAGYSDLVVLKDGAVGVLTETGVANYHQTIAFMRVPKQIIQENFK